VVGRQIVVQLVEAGLDLADRLLELLRL